MKPELTTEEAIKEAVRDLETAMLADLKAKQKIIEVNREKTKTHYDLVEARQRLDTLDLN